eukprot:TRINITY_DN2495_c1_g3_i1.p1 TRINITY_DN2495_c1_g3~~TRINITY_DN2495_c1_g3_i1.p1  ORF type:complete len:1323 (+),score=337.73 TRINITY_DN2495_c1_g3_i1:366-4334(+)
MSSSPDGSLSPRWEQLVSRIETKLVSREDLAKAGDKNPMRRKHVVCHDAVDQWNLLTLDQAKTRLALLLEMYVEEVSKSWCTSPKMERHSRQILLTKRAQSTDSHDHNTKDSMRYSSSPSVGATFHASPIRPTNTAPLLHPNYKKPNSSSSSSSTSPIHPRKKTGMFSPQPGSEQASLDAENVLQTLEDLMKVERAANAFEAFCVKAYCEENLLCWKEIVEYDRAVTASSGSEALKEQATRIRATYLIGGSEKEVNVDYDVREEVNEQLSAGKYDNLFDNVKHSLTHVIESDPLRKFRETDVWKKLAMQEAWSRRFEAKYSDPNVAASRKSSSGNAHLDDDDDTEEVMERVKRRQQMRLKKLTQPAHEWTKTNNKPAAGGGDVQLGRRGAGGALCVPAPQVLVVPAANDGDREVPFDATGSLSFGRTSPARTSGDSDDGKFIFDPSAKSRRKSPRLTRNMKVKDMSNKDPLLTKDQALLAIDWSAAKLEDVLADTKCRQLFEAFLCRTFADENLLFCDAVDSFKRKSRECVGISDGDALSSDLCNEAGDIITLFVNQGGKLHVNIDDDVRTQLESSYAAGQVSASMFDDARQWAYSLMQNDSMRKFQQQPEFKTFVEERSKKGGKSPPPRPACPAPARPAGPAPKSGAATVGYTAGVSNGGGGGMMARGGNRKWLMGGRQKYGNSSAGGEAMQSTGGYTDIENEFLYLAQSMLRKLGEDVDTILGVYPCHVCRHGVPMPGHLVITTRSVCYQASVFGMGQAHILKWSQVETASLGTKEDIVLGYVTFKKNPKRKQVSFQAIKGKETVLTLIQKTMSDYQRNAGASAVLEPALTRANSRQSSTLFSTMSMDGLPIERGLKKSDWKTLTQQAVIRNLINGHLVVAEGAPCSGDLFQVLNGRVVVDQKGTLVATMTKGALFGEMSFVEQKTYSASAIVASDHASVIVLEGKKLKAQFANDPALASRFYCYVARVVSSRLVNRAASRGRGHSFRKKFALPETETVVERYTTRFRTKTKKVFRGVLTIAPNFVSFHSEELEEDESVDSIAAGGDDEEVKILFPLADESTRIEYVPDGSLSGSTDGEPLLHVHHGEDTTVFHGLRPLHDLPSSRAYTNRDSSTTQSDAFLMTKTPSSGRPSKLSGMSLGDLVTMTPKERVRRLDSAPSGVVAPDGAIAKRRAPGVVDNDRRAELHDMLSPMEWKQLSLNGTRLMLKKRDMIDEKCLIEQGGIWEEGALYRVVQGIVLEVDGATNEELLVMRENDLFGIEGFLGAAPSNSLLFMSGTRTTAVLKLSTKHLDAILAANLDLATKWYKYLAKVVSSRLRTL